MTELELRVRKAGFENRICTSSLLSDPDQCSCSFLIVDNILPLVPEHSLAWLHLPSLSTAHQFLNFSWRSSQRFGPINSPGPGPLAKSLSLFAQDLRHFSTPPVSPPSLSPYLPIKVQCLRGQVRSWVHQEISSSLLRIFPLPSRVIYVCISLLLFLDCGFLQEEINSSLLQALAFALLSLLGCFEQNNSKFLLNKYHRDVQKNWLGYFVHTPHIVTSIFFNSLVEI